MDAKSDGLEQVNFIISFFQGILVSILNFNGYTLPETNSLPLKMDGWKTTFLLGWPIFRCDILVSGRYTISAFSGDILMGNSPLSTFAKASTEKGEVMTLANASLLTATGRGCKAGIGRDDFTTQDFILRTSEPSKWTGITGYLWIYTNWAVLIDEHMSSWDDHFPY